jgi:Domain of unknown function (DUF4055)
MDSWIDDVSRPCDEYTHMAKRWAVIDLILGDTLTIRDSKERVLPRMPFEKKGYDARLSQLVLTPWFTRLVAGLVGLVLRKEPNLTQVNALIADHLDDVTLTGEDFQDFLRSLLLSFARYGTVGILVDAPNVMAYLKSDEVAQNLRPYWTIYHACQILGFRTARVDNVRKLVQVRLLESVDEAVGLYGLVKVKQIRELTLRRDMNERGDLVTFVQWNLHRKMEETWEIFASGLLDVTSIPFYMCPDFAYGSPPFLQIAFMNIAETRKNAELDHLLSLCANQKAVFSGFDFEDEADGDGVVTLPPEDGYVSDNPSAKVTYVGANVEPATILMQRIASLQQDMMRLAIAAMVGQKNVAETAESKNIDRMQTDSMLAIMSDQLEKLVNSAVVGHGELMQVFDVGVIELNKDFSNVPLQADMARFYLELVAQKMMTIDTFFELLIRGDLFPEEFDKTAELERIKALSSTMN